MVYGHPTIKFMQEGVSFGFDGLEIEAESIRGCIVTKVEPVRTKLYTEKQMKEFKNEQ